MMAFAVYFLGFHLSTEFVAIICESFLRVVLFASAWSEGAGLRCGVLVLHLVK